MVKRKICLVLTCLFYSWAVFGQSSLNKLSTYHELKAGVNITQALKAALKATDTIYFDQGVFELDPIVIENKSRLRLVFNKTTLKAPKGSRAASLISIQQIPYLSLEGDLTLNGNFPDAIQTENFMQITAPVAVGSMLRMGKLRMERMGRSGVLVQPADALKQGYEKVFVQGYYDINGVGWNALNGTDIIYGLHFRGGHRFIHVDEVVMQNDQVAWTKVDSFPNFKNFSITAEVDPTQYPRPDSVYIGKIRAKYAATGFYTQAVTKLYIRDVEFDSSFRRPGVSDAKAYANVTYPVYSFFKSSWGSNKSPQSSFRIGRYLIKNTNPVLLKQENFMVGLWLNTGTYKGLIDTLDTDMPVSFSPDGQYDGQLNGEHRIKYFKIDIPEKPATAVSIGDGIQIDQLVLGTQLGVPLDLGICRIGSIKQLGNKQVLFVMQQPNYSLKNKGTLAEGTIVDQAVAKNIKWQFYWRGKSADLGKDLSAVDAYKYRFKNFTGDHYIQIFLVKDGALIDGNQAGLMEDSWTKWNFSYIDLDLEDCSFIHNSEYPGEITYKLFDPGKKASPIEWKPNKNGKNGNLNGMSFKNVQVRKNAQDKQGVVFNRQ